MTERPNSGVQPCAGLSYLRLEHFIKNSDLSFQNLDWLDPDQRFNEAGCLALLEDGQILAVLAATPECSEVAWLRFFFAIDDGRHTEHFKALMSQAKAVLRASGARSIYSLFPPAWMETGLRAEGFKETERITILRHGPLETNAAFDDPRLVIREITRRDLPLVEKIDSEAFPLPWRLNSASLEKAYLLSARMTIALWDGEAIGYQMSTNIFNSAHLARLAVLPEFQRRGVGRKLVLEMLDAFTKVGVDNFSVNTQSSNTSSLALYHALGYTVEDQTVKVLSLEL